MPVRPNTPPEEKNRIYSSQDPLSPSQRASVTRRHARRQKLIESSDSSSEEEQGFQHFRKGERLKKQTPEEKAVMRERMEGYIRFNEERVQTRLSHLAGKPSQTRGRSRVLGFSVETSNSYNLFYTLPGGVVYKIQISFVIPKWYKRLRYTPWLKEGVNWWTSGKGPVSTYYFRKRKVTSYPNKLLSYWELFPCICPSSAGPGVLIPACQLWYILEHGHRLKLNEQFQSRRRRIRKPPDIQQDIDNLNVRMNKLGL